MSTRRLVKLLLVVALLAVLPTVVQKVLLRLTGTVVRDERRSR